MKKIYNYQKDHKRTFAHAQTSFKNTCVTQKSSSRPQRPNAKHNFIAATSAWKRLITKTNKKDMKTYICSK